VHEFDFRRRKINWEAIAAFAVGTVASYLLIRAMDIHSSIAIFSTLIIVAVGGLWYHIRRVI